MLLFLLQLLLKSTLDSANGTIIISFIRGEECIKPCIIVIKNNGKDSRARMDNVYTAITVLYEITKIK